MSEHTVEKFGGTSMAVPETVAAIATSDIIVVSAPGIDESTPVKMTDALIRYSQLVDEGSPAATEAKDAIIDRYDGLYADLLGSKDRADLRDHGSSILTPSHRDDETYRLHVGEMLSAQYYSRLVGARCVFPAIRFNGDGTPNAEMTRQTIRQQVASADGNIVVPGFFGADQFRRLWLLGRGGSDRTGAMYAAALGRDYVNWTDVDGVFTADPKVVPGAVLIPELSREEVREGAHGGNGVLMGESVADLDGSKTVVSLRNTFNPDAPGTQIVPTRLADEHNAIVAVSGRNDLKEVTIRDMGMAHRQGYVAGLLSKFGKLGMSVEHMPAAQDAFSITTLTGETDEAKLDEFVDFARSHAISSSADVTVSSKGVVYAVGEGLREPDRRDMALQRTLGDMGVRGYAVEDIVSNRHSPSLAFLVQPELLEPVMQMIHAREIEGNGSVFKPWGGLRATAF